MRAISSSRPLLLPLAAAGLAAVALSGCNDSPTTAIVENGYPTATMTVFKVWWSATLFPSPVAPGETSEAERTIPASEYAYALLAPGWAPSNGTPPDRLVALKSTQKLSVAEHDLLRIAVSDDQFIGDCTAGKALDVEDAELVVGRVFPGDFGGKVYDPASCTSSAVSLDASAPGTEDAAAVDAGTD